MYKDIICGIYCIENKVTHQKYIGQSTNIYARQGKHKSELNNQIHFNRYLQDSQNTYGEDNFDFYVIEKCFVEELDRLERYYIKILDVTNSVYGFNLSEGGQDNHTVVEEVRKRMSESIKKSYENPILREIRRQNALKQQSNPEIKEKIMGKNNGMYGKRQSKEGRRKISETHKGKPNQRRNLTPVLCVELNKVFDNATVAGQELGFNGSGILQVCYGNRKTTHGYHQKFVNKEE